ncbi:hypothetical protein CEXT_724891, partial [Caerostris extrusa]
MKSSNLGPSGEVSVGGLQGSKPLLASIKAPDLQYEVVDHIEGPRIDTLVS